MGLGHLLHEGGDPGPVGDVEDPSVGALADLGRGGLDLAGIEVDQDDGAGALGHEGLHEGPADALGTARDHGDPVLQLHGPHPTEAG